MATPPEDKLNRLQSQVDVLQNVVRLLLHIEAENPKIAAFEKALRNELESLNPKRMAEAARITVLERCLAPFEGRADAPALAPEDRW